MGGRPQPIFDMSQAQPIAAQGKPLFDMSQAQPIQQSNAPQAAMGARNPPPVSGMAGKALSGIENWATDVANDIKYGSDVTGIGKLLKGMGAQGIYNGNSEAVGDFLGSIPLGAAKIAQGVAEIPQKGKGIQGIKNVAGGASQMATIPTALDSPGAGEAFGELGAGAERVATKVASKVASMGSKAAQSAAPVGRAISQTLAPDMIDIPVSASKGAATSGGAATSVTNREVLQHANDLGINLTPAQALQTGAAKSEQTLGSEALLTGGKINSGIAQSKIALEKSLEDFKSSLDPANLGMSAEATGEHLQNSAEIAKSALKDNVNNSYAQVKEQQADLAGDATGSLNNLIHDESFVRQPHAAVEQPVFQTAASKAALNDIQGMLEDPAMQGRQSIQSLRNLRTTLLEKGNDYGANALADSGQRIYKLAAGKVDDAIMSAAQGTPFEDTFRAAGLENAKLQSLYNTKGSPLYRILNTDDPAAVTNGILNRSSVHEIEALKGENFDLGPLARQAVEDIQNGGFRVTPQGLGGYPDTFLRSLLGPDATKELYLKGEIARRLAENYNPSGSGKVVLGISQINPKMAVAAQVARSRSMPQPALNFLPKTLGDVAGNTP